MISRTSNQVAAATAIADSRRAADAAVPGEGQALTSHTWSLSSGGMSLDFTYRRLENLSAATDRATAPAAQPAAVPAKASPAEGAPRPSFQEYLRRQQLAQLLVEPSRPPQGRQALITAQAMSAATAGPVCRAYAQAMGPLGAAGRSYTA